MLEFIDSIPKPVFEVMGTVAGLVACFFIAVQLVKEFKMDSPSSLSLSYIVGWCGVFVFWTFYGIRFRASAIFITNSMAAVLQGLLLYVVLRKAKKK